GDADGFVGALRVFYRKSGKNAVQLPSSVARVRFSPNSREGRQKQRDTEIRVGFRDLRRRVDCGADTESNATVATAHLDGTAEYIAQAVGDFSRGQDEFEVGRAGEVRVTMNIP